MRTKIIMTIKTIYIDLDGVMSNYDKNFKRLSGVSIEDAYAMGDDTVNSMKNDAKDNGLFVTMEPIEGAGDFFYQLITKFESDGIELKFLSAAGTHEHERSIVEKEEWVRKHLCKESEVICVIKSEDKAAYANDNSILIDDWDGSIRPFIEKGGYGILHNDFESTLALLTELVLVCR